jgi:hypothetical protein
MDGLVNGVMPWIERYSTNLTILLGALAITGLAWRKVLIPALRMLGDMRDSFQAVQSLAEAQLSSNGGSSLLDKVNKIEPNHDEVKAALAATEQTVREKLESAERVETERWTSLDQRLKALEGKPAATVIVNNDGHGVTQ